MPTDVYQISDVNLRSTWTSGNGTLDSRSRTVEVTIPYDGTLTDAILRVTCGGSGTGTRTLRVNDKNLETRTVNVVDVTSIVAARTTDEVTFTFYYQENGHSGDPTKEHAFVMSFTAIELAVTYTTSGGGDTPEEEEEVENRPLRTEAPENAIVLCDGFTRGVIALLHPLECTITEQAGGEYELAMVYPMNDDTWRHIKIERLIRAPVPKNHIDGIEVAVPEFYQVKANTTAILWKKPPSWYYKRNSAESGSSTAFPYDPTKEYTYGMVVSYGGAFYRYAAGDWHGVAPPDYPWFKIDISGAGTGSTTPAAEYVRVDVPGVKEADLAAGTKLIKLGDFNSSYMRVQTQTGAIGYVEISKTETVPEFDHDTIYSIQPKDITRQYFRIYSVEVSSYDRAVTVNARHISYDLDCMLLGDCAVVEADPQTALWYMRLCFLENDLRPQGQQDPVSTTTDEREIVTNITEGTITQDWSKGSPVSAILDPDTGIVDVLKARLYRDDDDFIILDNSSRNAEYTIRYGTNLLGVTVRTDTSGIITRIIPVAKDAEGAPYRLPEVYIDSGLIDKYAVIRYEVLDVNAQIGKTYTPTGSSEEETYTEATVKKKMRDEVAKRYRDDWCDQPEIAVEVEFSMLGDSEEYAQYRGLQSVVIYDFVRIIHPGIGIDLNIQVTGYEWDAILRRYKSISLGNPFRYGKGSVPGYQIGTRAVGERALSAGLKTRLDSMEKRIEEG